MLLLRRIQHIHERTIRERLPYHQRGHYEREYVGVLAVIPLELEFA
jgi:hypothetical protein